MELVLNFSLKGNVMKKSILLLVTALLLTGLAGCSMTKNRYNHYGVVKYLENKYDDKFEYYETYGGDAV